MSFSFAVALVELLEAAHAYRVAIRKTALVQIVVAVLQGVVVVLEDMVERGYACDLVAALRERGGIFALSMKVSLTSLSALTVALRSR